MMPKRCGEDLLQRHYRARRMLIILMGFSKALDTEEHCTLVKLLIRLPAHLLKHWLRNLLMHRDARVKLGNRLSPQ
ncbi:hypothetical protein JKF63_05384 [Porcisia hertigi]|uniref:Uncharacterized protein n=1 Tax=Porcisia hertigi TaxID=2761500 RepID=A0A836LF29_9TRYP|nr:hypothetical protein JKF63_05384 [Porcisia hertigi]